MNKKTLILFVLAVVVLGGIMYFGSAGRRQANNNEVPVGDVSPTPTLLPSPENAPSPQRQYPALSLRLDKQIVKIGEVVTADVVLDAGNDAVIAVSAHLTYDPTLVSAESVSADGSPFTIVANKSIDAGRVEMDVAQWLPGVNGFEAFVGRIQFKALRAGTVRINFDFSGPGLGSSRAMSSDGSVTDLLAAVNGATVTIVE